MTWPALPIFLRVAGRPVILLGDGEAAAAKRRLLERAGAIVVANHPDARVAVVAIEDEAAALAAVERLRARGVLVNAVDRPDLCDFTLPAIVDRSPVLLAIGTGGVSAGLAAALRQRLETLLPMTLGALATALQGARTALRDSFPDGGARRRAIGAALQGPLDPLDPGSADRVGAWLRSPDPGRGGTVTVVLTSADPDELSIGQARALALADRVFHHAAVPATILDRARADAARIECDRVPDGPGEGLNVWVEMAA